MTKLLDNDENKATDCITEQNELGIWVTSSNVNETKQIEEEIVCGDGIIEKEIEQSYHNVGIDNTEDDEHEEESVLPSTSPIQRKKVKKKTTKELLLYFLKFHFSFEYFFNNCSE